MDEPYVNGEELLRSMRDNMRNNGRLFEISYCGEIIAAFYAARPRQAAKMGFSHLTDERKATGEPIMGPFKFSVTEIKEKGSNKKGKTRNYIGKNVKLSEPIEVNIEGKTITYSHRQEIKPDKSG